MIVKLLTEHHLEFLSLKGGYRGSSESTLVKLLEITCHGSFHIIITYHSIYQYNINSCHFTISVHHIIKYQFILS